jgi:hypothetical protein
MTDELVADSYYVARERDSKAESLRNRQLRDQQKLLRLQNRTDYVVQPGVIGTQGQSLRRAPMGEFQRVPVGQQIVQDPALLKRVIMPTPMPSVPRPVAVSTKPYIQKIQKPPMQAMPTILYAGGLPTGIPVKKWPSSFKKAFHKPTADESIMRGLSNLDNMSKSVLGKW